MSNKLVVLGFMLIFLGVILALIIPLLLLTSGEVKHSGVAVIIIGPLPLIFSWGELSSQLLIIAIVILAILVVLLLLLLFKTLR